MLSSECGKPFRCSTGLGRWLRRLTNLMKSKDSNGMKIKSGEPRGRKRWGLAQGRRLKVGQSPQKIYMDGTEMPIISEIFNKIYICTLFSTVRTGSCVVCIVLKLQYHVGNCLLFRFHLFRH